MYLFTPNNISNTKHIEKLIKEIGINETTICRFCITRKIHRASIADK
jgi:hypothetical protein